MVDEEEEIKVGDVAVVEAKEDFTVIPVGKKGTISTKCPLKDKADLQFCNMCGLGDHCL